MLRYFLTSFFVSGTVAIVLTPIVRSIALAFEVIDKPGGRKTHRKDTRD